MKCTDSILSPRPSARTKPYRITSHWHHRRLNRTTIMIHCEESSQGFCQRPCWLHSTLIATRPMKTLMHEPRNLPAYSLDQTSNRDCRRPAVGPQR
jgi:hypothetical protein